MFFPDREVGGVKGTCGVPSPPDQLNPAQPTACGLTYNAFLDTLHPAKTKNAKAVMLTAKLSTAFNADFNKPGSTERKKFNDFCALTFKSLPNYRRCFVIFYADGVGTKVDQLVEFSASAHFGKVALAALSQDVTYSGVKVLQSAVVVVPGNDVQVDAAAPCALMDLQGLCANGGKCQRSGDNLSCKCQPGFLGSRCELQTGQQAKDEDEMSDATLIALIIGGAIVVLILVVIVIKMCTAPSKKQRQQLINGNGDSPDNEIYL